MAAASYRALLRTVRQVFGADVAAVRHCSREARTAFRANVSERDPTRVKQLLADAAEAAEFLRSHIAQARLNASGRYEMALQPEYAEAGSNMINVTPAAAAAEGKAPRSTTPESGCCGGGCHS